MKVRLVQDIKQRDPYLSHYMLHVERPGHEALVIHIGNGSNATGFVLDDWKLTMRKGREVIGVFLFISAMGHELDQWAYYDLETGEKVP